MLEMKTFEPALNGTLSQSPRDQAHALESRLPAQWHRSLWGVRLPAIITALIGLLNVWSSVTPALPPRVEIMRDVLPFEVRHGSHLTTALFGFALLLLAHELWRRKEVALVLTLFALPLSAVAHVLKGLDFEEAICTLMLACWLWRIRHHFHARSDAPSVAQGLRVSVAAFVFTLAYGTLGFYLLDEHFRQRFSFGDALQQTLTMFTQFYDPGLEPVTHFGRYFADSIYGVAIVTFGYAVLMLARPVILRHPATADERARAKAIVEQYGRTALAFCALFEDKSYWFAPGGSLVQYTVEGRVAVALGDPIGPADDAVAAIHGFVHFCEQNDWRPAWYEVYDEFLSTYSMAGLTVVRIAHEAIMDVQAFTLAGKEGKSLRNVINAITKAGHRAEVHQPPLADEFLEELRNVSDGWLAMMHGSEKQFSLGWFDDDYIRACPIMAIHDPSGAVAAFANIVPEYQLNESTIDLMRRCPDTAKGTMELLFVSLFEWAQKKGFATFNLGPSPFAGVGEHSDDPAIEKALHFIYEHMDQFYNFKGLYAFKQKFHPTWRPIYLAYSGAAGLPAVAAAIIRADSGQKTWWDFIRHLRGKHAEPNRAPELRDLEGQRPRPTDPALALTPAVQPVPAESRALHT